MSATTLRILLALFVIAHGWIHFSLTYAPLPASGGMHTPFWPSLARPNIDSSWPASRLGLPAGVVRIAGWVLLMAALVGYVAAGLGLLGLPGLSAIWQGSAILASLASLVLLAFYWHPWLVMGGVISLGILVAIQVHWPQALFANG